MFGLVLAFGLHFFVQTSNKSTMDGIHSKTICRTCLYESSELTPIFDLQQIEDDLLTISEIIYSCTDLEIYSNDQLPQFICESCIRTVIKCYIFRKRCHDSDIILRSTEIIEEVKTADDELLDIEEADEVKSGKPEFDDESFSDYPELPSNEAVEINSNYEDKIDPPELDTTIKNTNQGNDNIRIKGNISRPKIVKVDCEQCDTQLSTEGKCDHQHFLCNICGKKFTVKNSFHSHMRIHSKRHICEVCSKSFSDIFQLKMHMHVHTGERPYKCLYCPSAYTQNAYLRIHMRTHTKEKPYKCPSCDISFISKRKLRLHEVEHNPEKFKCAICSKCFRTGESLKRHQSAHTGGIRRFCCEQCPLGFNSKRDLARHVENHDKELIIDC